MDRNDNPFDGDVAIWLWEIAKFYRLGIVWIQTSLKSAIIKSISIKKKVKIHRNTRKKLWIKSSYKLFCYKINLFYFIS